MKRNKSKREFRPYGWQLDSTSLCTQSDDVQYWRNGLMAFVIKKTKAIELVNSGAAFVMTEQAVGAMVDGVSVA